MSAQTNRVSLVVSWRTDTAFIRALTDTLTRQGLEVSTLTLEDIRFASIRTSLRSFNPSLVLLVPRSHVELAEANAAARLLRSDSLQVRVGTVLPTAPQLAQELLDAADALDGVAFGNAAYLGTVVRRLIQDDTVQEEQGYFHARRGALLWLSGLGLGGAASLTLYGLLETGGVGLYPASRWTEALEGSG
ncbi:MAG: hypothetical protein ACKO6N_04725, partial [Myxococcota bacterium]